MFNFITSGKHIFCVNDNLSIVLSFHNMVYELKFFRYETTPWGFRLTGGSDFDYPLTVIKVTEGSLAENAGMKIGDVVVRVNDTPISNLNHGEAHDFITKCGNNFLLAVIRPDEISEEQAKKEAMDATNADEMITNDDIINQLSSCTATAIQHIQRPDSSQADGSEISQQSFNSSSSSRMTEKTCATKSTVESEKFTEEHIAELMSGEAEVLKEHNIIGVNFQKIIPKAGMFKSSEVFKQLNEEAMKTKADKEIEQKKWTTFLQKPNRPIPKSKAELEREAMHKAHGYRVRICKQPKPRCAPNRTPTPPGLELPENKVVTEQLNPEQETGVNEEQQNNTNNNNNNTDKNESEIELVPGPEPQYVEYLNDNENNNNNTNDLAINLVDSEMNQNQSTNEMTILDESNQMDDGQEQNEQEQRIKSDEELLLEKQLLNVQQQLLQLSSLPSTIQATLDAVTKQLADLVPNFKLQKQQELSVCCSTAEIVNDIECQKKNCPENECNKEDECIVDDSNCCRKKDHHNDNKQSNEECEEIQEILNNTEMDATTTTTTTSSNVENIHTITAVHTNIDGKKSPHIETYDDDPETKDMLEKQKMEKIFRKQEEEWLRKRQKEQNNLKVELEQRIITRGNPKRPPKTLGILTPQERPLVLPGGRKWRNEKDAYNEEFIAEIISSQAELITGSTLGNKYESPLLGYDERINFLKYKKPEKDLSNLNKSEVFKMIHNMDREPKHGIPARPSKVMAAEDIRLYNSPVSYV